MYELNVTDMSLEDFSKFTETGRLLVFDLTPPEVHNVTHNATHHTIYFTNGETVTHTNHPPGYGDLGTSVANWYQLNMGLIGIGALAVVAIVGSRNFFSNFLTSKYPYGWDSGGISRQDSYGPGGYGYDAYDRRSWYDEWYDYWYRTNPDPYDDVKKEARSDPYAQEEDYYNYNRRSGRTLKYRDKERIIKDATVGNKTETNNDNSNKHDHKGFSDSVSKMAAHCGFRLLCELSRLRKRPLTDDEREILRLIKFDDLGLTIFKAGEGVLPNNTAIQKDFEKASRLGSENFKCEKLLGTCRINKKKMNDSAKKLDTYLATITD